MSSKILHCKIPCGFMHHNKANTEFSLINCKVNIT